MFGSKQKKPESYLNSMIESGLYDGGGGGNRNPRFTYYSLLRVAIIRDITPFYLNYLSYLITFYSPFLYQ